jgi:hypothetical protein
MVGTALWTERNPGFIRASDDIALPGPTSSRTDSDSAVSVEIHDENCTVPRRCPTQYSGSVACVSVIQVPVRFETHRTLGGVSVIDER